MQPIPNIVSPAQPLTGGLMPGMQGQPETAGFDFMSYLLGLQVNPTDNAALMPEAPQTAAVKPAKDLSKDPLAALFSAVPNALQRPVADLTQTVAESMASPESVRVSGNPNPALPTPGEIPSMVADPAIGGTDPTTGFRLDGFRKVEGDQAVDVSLSKTSPAHAAKKYAASGPAVEKPASAERLPLEAEAVATQQPLTRPVPTGSKKPVESGRSSDGAVRLDGFTNVSVFGSSQSDAPAAVTPAAASNPMLENVAVPEVFQRVESLVQKGGGEMTVSLDPPDLGKLEIKVTARGNRVEVEMRSESLQAKSALESHLPDLKSAMQAHDLQLTKLEVQVHRDPQSWSHSFAGMADGRSAGGAQGERNQNQTRSLPESDRRLSAVSAQVQPMRSAPLVTGDGRIDRKV